jgi:hypothetical protein
MHDSKDRWTDYDRARLLEMKAEGKFFSEIGRRLGRSKNAVAEQWRWLSKGEEWRARRRVETAAYRRRWGKTQRREYLDHNQQRFVAEVVNRPSQELLADATKRLIAPRTLTGSLCGDPPVGYSALDRRQGARNG